MRRLLHNLTHRHMLTGKSGLGDFLSCGWLFSTKVNVMFRPDLTGADWHAVTGIETMRRMMAADDANAAMTVLRTSEE